MPSLFDEFDRQVQVDISEQTGEGIRLFGMVGGDYSHGPDPAREAADTVATVSISPRTADLRGQMRGTELSGAAQFASLSSELWIDHVGAAALPWKPRRNDVVELTERGAQRCTITAVFPESGGLLIQFAQGATPTGG
ncbi:hypothetical protein SAMN05892877_13235 [Rhizobium subbaraonis]|uniref:Uncharacterized protein n=1 Tax=Rhizobium subbaraonis TaxID=908946 RepID=A0A285V0W1_9HYPH|nr:hypothetical protein [Rhizobium subbaraonis]SOC47702.1 hypothetical protein SAMN05892877_13235 [Rhizobium subbaraonis]